MLKVTRVPSGVSVSASVARIFGAPGIGTLKSKV